MRFGGQRQQGPVFPKAGFFSAELPREKLKIEIPLRVLENNDFVIRYLRGLYEAEGSFCVHKPTGTYKMFFANRNGSMLENVSHLVWRLGFHPHRTKQDVQLSRKEEVYRFKNLIKFRKY